MNAGEQPQTQGTAHFTMRERRLRPEEPGGAGWRGRRREEGGHLGCTPRTTASTRFLGALLSQPTGLRRSWDRSLQPRIMQPGKRFPLQPEAASATRARPASGPRTGHGPQGRAGLPPTASLAARGELVHQPSKTAQGRGGGSSAPAEATRAGCPRELGWAPWTPLVQQCPSQMCSSQVRYP